MSLMIKVIIWVMRCFIALVSLYKVATGDFFGAILYVLAFFVTLIPIIINNTYNVKLHWIFEFSFTFLFFWHMLGFLGLYDLVPLWDDIGHLTGGATLALICFGWVYSMNVSKRISMTLPMIGFISITWSVTVGVLWEIIEFIWDSNLGLISVYGYAQNGLIDTMTDLTYDIIAAVCMVLVYMYFLSEMKQKTKDSIINPFVSINEKR